MKTDSELQNLKVCVSDHISYELRTIIRNIA
jgi:hypothetical protein